MPKLWVLEWENAKLIKKMIRNYESHFWGLFVQLLMISKGQ